MTGEVLLVHQERNMAAPTTFENNVRIGDKLNSATGELAALGYVAVAQSSLVGFADDGSAVDICVIPANSQIIEIYVDVLTAFDDTGSDLLDIGVSGTADLFAADLDLSSTGRILGSSDASQLANYDDIGTSQITVQALYTGQNSDSTAGSARVTVLYIPNNNLA